MYQRFKTFFTAHPLSARHFAAMIALAVHSAAHADIQTERLRGSIAPTAPAEAVSSTAGSTSEITPETLFRQGLAYDLGRGVPQDYGKALALYREAADLGHVGAMLSLGLMLSQGQGTPANPTAGFEWLQRAAERGSADGQYSVGVLLMQGRGLERDYGAAALWFRRAAESGHAEAMNNLGVINANGLGKRSDPVRAYAWFKLASTTGSEDGEENRRVTEQELAPSDVKLGGELADELSAELGL